jgi:hypothetical protein
MATRKKAKKAKAKPARKSARKPAQKPVARKTVRAVKKTVAKKKSVAKKKPVARKKPAVVQAVTKKPKKPAPPAAPPAPAPLVGEERVGVVTHYYGHLSVAAVMIDTLALRVGDTIHVVGHTSDFRQKVESMQLEHESVEEALPDQEIGLKVTEHAREHDVVYKVPTSQS